MAEKFSYYQFTFFFKQLQKTAPILTGH